MYSNFGYEEIDLVKIFTELITRTAYQRPNQAIDHQAGECVDIHINLVFMNKFSIGHCKKAKFHFAQMICLKSYWIHALLKIQSKTSFWYKKAYSNFKRCVYLWYSQIGLWNFYRSACIITNKLKSKCGKMIENTGGIE